MESFLTLEKRMRRIFFLMLLPTLLFAQFMSMDGITFGQQKYLLAGSRGGGYDANVYYVTSSGDNSNDGHSAATAWKDITKVNSSTFAPGNFIKFNSGETFSGQINISQAGTVGLPITVGAYGAGNRPIIFGGDTLTTWVRRGIGDSIWVHKGTSDVGSMFVNGEKMTVARWPNRGYNAYPRLGVVPITSGNLTTTFGATEMTQPTGTWDGGNIHIRYRDWEWDTNVITTQVDTLITCPSAGWAAPISTCFYIDNKLSALDTVKEYYHNTTTDTTYYRPPNGVNPNTQTIVGVTQDYGVNVATGKHYITIDGLHISHFNKSGVHFVGTVSPRDSQSVVQNCKIEKIGGGTYTEGWGVDLDYSTKMTVNDNVIQDCIGGGIKAQFSNWLTAYRDTVRRIYLPEYAGLSWAGYGLLSNAGYGHFKWNYIDSTGYTGIFPSNRDTVMYNIVRYAVMTVGDGGAIYFSGGADSSLCRKNVVSFSQGNPNGYDWWTLNPIYWTFAGGHGLYLDHPTRKVTVDSNTSYKNRTMNLAVNYGSFGLVIKNNTFYKGGENAGGNSINFVVDSVETVDHNYGQGWSNNAQDSLLNNIIFQRTVDQWPIVMTQQQTFFGYRGPVMNNNYWFDAYDKKKMMRFYSSDPVYGYEDFSLNGWRIFSGQDANSDSCWNLSGQGDTLLVNETRVPIDFTLTGIWLDIDSVVVSSPLTVQPYSSMLLTRPVPLPLQFVSADSAMNDNGTDDSPYFMATSVPSSTNRFSVVMASIVSGAAPSAKIDSVVVIHNGARYKLDTIITSNFNVAWEWAGAAYGKVALPAGADSVLLYAPDNFYLRWGIAHFANVDQDTAWSNPRRKVVSIGGSMEDTVTCTANQWVVNSTQEITQFAPYWLLPAGTNTQIAVKMDSGGKRWAMGYRTTVCSNSYVNFWDDWVMRNLITFNLNRSW